VTFDARADVPERSTPQPSSITNRAALRPRDHRIQAPPNGPPFRRPRRPPTYGPGQQFASRGQTMNGTHQRLRRAGVFAFILGAVGFLAAGATGLAAAQTTTETTADSSVEQPFAADSGDPCRYGEARGVIDWHLGPLATRPTVVDVEGRLLDRPLPDSPVAPCGGDRRFSTVTLTAYARGAVVDSAVVRADNGVREFRLQLVNTANAARIERLTVQVCRLSSAGDPAESCGSKQEYRAPLN
jgi:hypothetical protein